MTTPPITTAELDNLHGMYAGISAEFGLDLGCGCCSSCSYSMPWAEGVYKNWDSLIAAARRGLEAGVTLRPSVADFAQRMEMTLRKHDATKGGQANWRKDMPESLIRRIEDELVELKSADGLTDQAKECVDVANFCLMVHDVLVRLADDALDAKEQSCE